MLHCSQGTLKHMCLRTCATCLVLLYITKANNNNDDVLSRIGFYSPKKKKKASRQYALKDRIRGSINAPKTEDGNTMSHRGLSGFIHQINITNTKHTIILLTGDRTLQNKSPMSIYVAQEADLKP